MRFRRFFTRDPIVLPRYRTELMVPTSEHQDSKKTGSPQRQVASTDGGWNGPVIGLVGGNGGVNGAGIWKGAFDKPGTAATCETRGLPGCVTQAVSRLGQLRSDG